MNEEPTRKDKLRKTFAAKRARGESVGRVPLGFTVRYDPHTGVGKVVEDPNTLPLVREARRMREEGHSIRTICRVMASKGLRGKLGRPLSAPTMSRILREPSPRLP